MQFASTIISGLLIFFTTIGFLDYSGAATVPPKRLNIIGNKFYDQTGTEVHLRGVNLEGATPSEAADIADNLHMNFVRLRISFESPNIDGNGNFTASYKAKIATAINALSSKQIWIDLEMRTDDATANTAPLYDTKSTTFSRYLNAWKYLATTYKNTDYLMGYGVLAEPSADKTTVADPKAALISFQAALMAGISAIDAVTPFVLGPNFNYDTMQYRFDDFYTSALLTPYHGRLIYAVNFLMPKPWIQDGSSPWKSQVTYPITPFPSSYDSLLQVKAGDHFTQYDFEKIYGTRRQEPGNFEKLLSPGFIPWYLQWPLAFSNKFQVPILVDQFGASAGAGGQLAFENNLISYLDENGVSWCRWAYNAGSSPRMLTHDVDAYRFYQTYLSAGPPQIEIQVQPVSQSVKKGSSAMVSVQATGADLSYQWYLNNSVVPAATSETYTFAAYAKNLGSYYVVISNATARITSNEAAITLSGETPQGPTIQVQPTSQRVQKGSRATLSVKAVGSSLLYQWYFNGSPIRGATLPQLTVAAYVKNLGKYFVIVSNPQGTITSTTADVSFSN